jgi:hypothetical protein
MVLKNPKTSILTVTSVGTARTPSGLAVICTQHSINTSHIHFISHTTNCDAVRVSPDARRREVLRVPAVARARGRSLAGVAPSRGGSRPPEAGVRERTGAGGATARCPDLRTYRAGGRVPACLGAWSSSRMLCPRRSIGAASRQSRVTAALCGLCFLTAPPCFWNKSTTSLCVAARAVVVSTAPVRWDGAPSCLARPSFVVYIVQSRRGRNETHCIYHHFKCQAGLAKKENHHSK